MDLPVKFPSETEVILEDVARFRALSPADRMRALHEMLREGNLARRNSPDAASIDEEYREQGRLKRANIRDFLARHAR